MGADTVLIGIAYTVSALSEIPFLLLADKILKKIGIKNMLLISGIAISLRWFLLSQTTQIGQVLAVQLLHGLIFVVLTLTIAVYINENIQNELKASGQSLNTISGMWFSRIVGSILGGAVSRSIDLRQIFFISSFVCFAAVIAFFALKDRFRTIDLK